MKRILRKGVGDYTITATAFDVENDETVVSGTPTVTMTDPTGAAITGLTAEVDTGKLTSTVPNASMPFLGVYPETWAYKVGDIEYETTTELELVSGFYFSIGDLRAYDSPAFALTAAQDLEDAREWAEQSLEAAACRAWVERATIETHIGDGGMYLMLEQGDVREVLSVTVDGVALSADALAALVVFESGMLKSLCGWWPNTTVVVHYTYGKRAVHPRVRRAALILARQYLTDSVLSSRAIAEQTELGYIRLSIAGRDHTFGIPEVDETLRALGRSGTFVG